VTLCFREKVIPAFSSFIVTNAAGNRVDDGKIAVDPHNAQELRVALQPLAPGIRGALAQTTAEILQLLRSVSFTPASRPIRQLKQSSLRCQ
jgi:hypothetical protein